MSDYSIEWEAVPDTATTSELEAGIATDKAILDTNAQASKWTNGFLVYGFFSTGQATS